MTGLIGMLLRVIRWSLMIVGGVGLILGAMIATPLSRPPELASISATARAVDRSDMPPAERHFARDGTELAYRHYAPVAEKRPQVAILVHGSSGSSVAVHALSRALAERGVEVFAPDIRGHGGSGTRGDIGYIGQLEDDMADLVALVRKSRPEAPLTLIGHSAGAGFALRVTGSSLQDQFARTVLLAPYLGYDAPSNRPDSGGWANADIPRFIALMQLAKFGLPCCEQLPVLAFAVPANSEKFLASTYSFRLMRNFATKGYKLDFAAARRPITLFGAANDELMLSDKYAETVHAVVPAVEVKLIDGINHMDIVSAPVAVAAIADDVIAH